MRRVCSETGFLGEPQEAVFIGREVFADLWTKYWTDYEPESALVAEAGGEVQGHLLGCLETRRQIKVFNREILPGILRKMVLSSWWLRPVNVRFIRAMIRSRMRGEFDLPMGEIIKEHPAHLHTNIADPALRGRGIGKRMMEEYFHYLQARGVKGVHLGTTSHNRQAVPFYRRMGFETVVEKRLTLYDHAIPDPPLYMLYMARKIE